jgi:hypothetical protein
LYNELRAAGLNQTFQNIFSPPLLVDSRQGSICFRAPRDFLAVPYELLHDDRSSIALLAPIYHQVTDYAPKPTQSFAKLVQELQRATKPLHVLLLAEDDDACATQIDHIQQYIESKARIKVIFTRASGSECLKALQSSTSFHLIHFEGRAIHNIDVSDESYFSLTSEQRITALQLARCLEGNQVCLFYVNGWVGSELGRSDALLGNSYFSVIDAALSSGVAHVVGFRWLPPAQGRAEFAKTFYEHLLSHPFAPEIAVYEARRAVSKLAQGDLTWMSSLLVSQQSYLLAESSHDWSDIR